MGFWTNVTQWLGRDAAAAQEAKTVSLRDLMGDLLGMRSSAAGVSVTPLTAMQSAAVYACVKVLAESVGMLPCNVYRTDANGARRMAEDHPLWALLHGNPNEWQTSVDFFEMLVTHLNLRGNAYVYIVRTMNGVEELIPLHPDSVTCEMQPGYRLSYKVADQNGREEPVPAEKIMHIRGLTLDGWNGLSPVTYAREAIGLALATEKFGATLFRNGAKPGGVLELPGTLSKDAYDRLKANFDAATSGDNAHKTMVLEQGAKFQKIGLSNEDSQFLETRKYQRSEIAGIFRIPPHMIGDLERATFSNIEQMALEFVNFSLTPWLNRIEKACKRALMAPDERRDLHIRFDVSKLIRGDTAAREKYYASGVTNGWLTRNEARMMESDLGIALNPLPLLDAPLVPLNMTEAGEEPDDAEDEADTEDDTTEADAGADSPAEDESQTGA